MDYLAVALAGGLGAAARHGVVRCMGPCSTSFPSRWPELAGTAVLAGFLGGFTTFSSFAFDTVRLLDSGRLLAATANVLGQNLQPDPRPR